MIKYMKIPILTFLILVIISCDSTHDQTTFDVEDDNLGLNLEGKEVSLFNKSDQDIYLFAVTAELLVVMNWAPIIDGTPDLVSKETKSFQVTGSDYEDSVRYIVYYWFESDDVDGDGLSVGGFMQTVTHLGI
ncbi:MAG: hypothetical protein V3S48_05385 [Candidatus Neomarinimicrobiota bacterium]